MRWILAILAVTLAIPAAAAGPPPWQRTETRQPCASFDLFRNAYFGDLHIHTKFSADAYIFGTRVGPPDAYAFAQGATIPFSDDDEQQTRSGQIDRPLDFASVTDHSEWYGEVNLCTSMGSPVYDLSTCQLLRQVEQPANRFPVTVAWLYPAGIPNPTHLPLCTTPGVDCTASAISVWQQIQAAAEGAYDRTSTCGFTSFVGYEYTASPLGRHLHRNIIFRNAIVPTAPASYIETAAGGTPQGVWTAIENECLNAGTGCDAVIIPHNPNLSGGLAWPDPADANEALRRQTIEPLVEIHQIKGNSECRFDRLVQAGAGTADEDCTFEQQTVAHQGPDATDLPIDQYPLRNMVRNTLKDGLALEQNLGVNPFRLGFIGSTDNHNGAGGSVAEEGWLGGIGGNEDSSPDRQVDNIRNNPGGLAVAWAEENSRDAIFSALKRRETYATSGTRPVVRFFAGDLADVRCGSASFVRDAYASGTPMGGEIGPVENRRSPRFAVWAAKDPGTAQNSGTDLQRVQIVKGWVDTMGQTHERVFDVAGNANNGASVDPSTCAPTGSGSPELCAVWTDPAFNRDEGAFYYARVLENPTCRWSTRVCKAGGVDPFSPDCATQAAAAGTPWQNCCLGPENDAFLDPVIQERAWTSPIWYRPENVARLRGEVQYGHAPGHDRLRLRIRLGSAPAQLDPTQTDMRLTVSDDDNILDVTFPAGSLVSVGSGRFVLKQPIGPVHSARLVLGQQGASMRIATGPTDLSHADQSDHMVTVALAAGVYRASHTRLWIMRGGRLTPGGR